MGQLTHFGDSRASTRTMQARGIGEDDAGALVGVGGAYHTEPAWDRFAMASVPYGWGNRLWDEQSALPWCEGAGTGSRIEKQHAEDALAESRRELQQLAARLVTIQEWERQRIAADLHDGIGQSLSLIKLAIEAAIGQISLGTHIEAADALQQLTHKVKDTIAELRRTVMDLRPPMLDDFGLLPTLSWFFREFEAVWGARKFEKIIAIQESDVPAPLKTAIFRIVQEAVNNTVKHAHADWLRINLAKVDSVLLFSIEDNGQGFDPSAASNRLGGGRGFGLVTMLERARSSDGALEVKSAPGCGTRISISWRQCTSGTEHGAAGLHSAF